MSDDLDDLIRRVDPDRWLSSRFIGDPALSTSRPVSVSPESA